MSTELLLVKDGLYLGRPTAPPGLADGLYEFSSRIPDVAPQLTDLGLFESVDEESVINQDGRKIYLSPWPLFSAGLSVRVYYREREYYYLVEGQGDLADRKSVV